MELLKRHPIACSLLFYGGALLLGFALTRGGLSTCDSPAHRKYMLWLIGQWRGEELPLPFEGMRWYTPLWEYVLALFTAAFRFLDDPLWVRQAVNFTLLPSTLVVTFLSLRGAGESRGTALLAVALLASNVRFVGHSLVNVKDFPLACGYLLSTLLLWNVLNQKMAGLPGLLRRPGWLFVATLLSVVPYMLRAPVMQHWLLLVVLCLWAALRESKPLPGKRKWPVALLPLVTGPLVVWSLWPTLWEAGPRGFTESFAVFSKYAWLGRVRLFGQTYLPTELPWWYGPAWIPVSWEPCGLALLVVGLASFAGVVARTARQGWRRPIPLLLESLPLWVALFALVPWVAVLVLRPVLYDEDRHLLFAMPLLAVSAALGLRALGETARVVLSCIVLVSSVYAVGSWGKYAYVYKDPLLPRTANEDFMGDYWGAASGAMAQALYDHVPSGSTVVVIAPLDSLVEELQRRESSLLVHAPRPKSFRLEGGRGPSSGPFYVVAWNRNGVDRWVLEDIREGRAREVWREQMPPGDSVAAVLAYYTEPWPHGRPKQPWL